MSDPQVPKKRKRKSMKELQYGDYGPAKLQKPFLSSSRELALAEQEAERKREEERLLNEGAELAARKAKEAAERPPAPDGQRGDGKFYAAFVKMGQGDCALFTTPKGQLVMIDCGTTCHDSEEEAAYRRRVSSIVGRTYFLGVSTTIDILILSHPDRDHFNLLDTVLPTTCAPSLIYHSGQFSDYGSGAQWAYPKIAKQFIKRVTANRWDGQGGWTLAGRAVPPWPANARPEETIEKLDSTGGITIVNEPDCKITIMAGEMEADPAGDGDDGTNRGSIVTFVEIFGIKILVCADATRSTEAMLMRQHGDRLRDLHLVQAGHHGSNRTSSSEAFVRHVNTFAAVISAGEVGHRGYHLPSWNVIRRYERQMATPGRTWDKRLTTAWDDSFEPASSTVAEVSGPVYVTGSHDTQYIELHPL
ncbi:ComEC/Rec2 family competence protein [Nonomuraea sp. NPDC050536]|uniref:ComEC/Rec2 family competence protein n=1 Tax=Nonomuraea sp. NPDC050536 TaxID=3364366 RepID=UPI0037C84467